MRSLRIFTGVSLMMLLGMLGFALLLLIVVPCFLLCHWLASWADG